MSIDRALTLTAALAALTPTWAAAQQGDVVLLELRLTEGQAFEVRMSTGQEISQNVFGQPQDVQQTTDIGYTMRVTDVDEDGTAVAEWTYDAVRFSMDGFMGPIEYDSSDPPTDIHPLARGYAALVGQNFVTRMTPSGRVLEARGFNNIMERVFDELGLPEGPQADAARQQLENMFGDQAMKDLFSALVAVYPSGPVTVGDSWSREYVITTGFPIKVEDTYTLQERSGGVAYIEVKSGLTTSPDAPPMQMGQVSMAFDILGSQTGRLEMDEATGWIIRSSVEQSFSGTVSVVGVPELAEGMSWPITVKTTLRLQTQ